MSFGTLLAEKLCAKGYAFSESTTVEKAGLAMILPPDMFGASFSPKTMRRVMADSHAAQCSLLQITASGDDLGPGYFAKCIGA